MLVAILWTRIATQLRRSILASLTVIPVAFLVTSFLPHVAWLGHLGGLFGGAAAAVIWAGEANTSRKVLVWRIAGVAVLVILLAVTIGVLAGTAAC